MRTLILAGLTMVTVLGTGAANAQRIGYPGAPYPVPGRYPVQQPGGGLPMVQTPGYPVPQPVRGYSGGSRWGGQIGGRWYGGVQAPGGWNAYRRPIRGWHVPSYWISPNFYISDYTSYGLGSPPQGYSWHRYYDDAVLIDSRGRVWDSRGGIDWDGGGYAYGGAGGYASSEYGYDDSGRGAGGTGYGAPQPGYASVYPSLPPIGQGGALTTYQTGGYPGTTTTVVTIQPTETLTTTTTEYVEETRYAAPRRVYRAPKRHYRVVRQACGCGCCR